MAVEKITLNLIPTGETPTIHAAQFDKERAFQIELKEGEDDFSLTGYTIELQVRKVDNNIVTAVPSQVSSNIVTFLTTEQMTACSGTNLAELQISKNNMSIATLHFYLVVQRDVLAGGLSSQSEIYDLEEQIAAIVPEVIGDEYYTADQVDEKIAEIPTFDPTNYYDKTETNGLLSQKANTSSLSTVAFTGSYDDLSDKPTIAGNAEQLPIESGSATNTKDYIDSGLSGKADTSDTYTKEEVDNKVYNVLPTDTASGSIAHFTDGADNIPVKSLVSEIVAVESGSGEKSPTNPYTISGFDNAVVTRCGKNLYQSGNVTEQFDVVGVFWTLGGTLGSNVPDGSLVLNAGTYTLSNFPTKEIRRYNEAGARVATAIGTMTFTLAKREKVKFSIVTNSQDYNVQIEIGGTATTYEAYNSNNYTVAFGQTVYGGHFDNKGNLVVTHSFIASYNGETINEPWISSMDNYVPNTSPSIGAQVVYPLTTPITISITSQDIPTLLGENNIYSNCGDVEVDYHADIGLYIDKKISSLAQGG